jgi:tRNA nucleotidyltransferase (CCA-adding enzyme)
MTSASAISPPPAVREIADRLERAGFETWCVGGAVRDALLGHVHLDWDLATSARPEQVKEVFGHRRTIPVGIDFGTVGVLDRNGRLHEVTTFRRDVRTDGRHAEVEFGVSLEDDLARRDFTVNAIAFHPARGELKDPFDGRRDLAEGIVRAVGDAGARMREDRLRALRALRFAARFGFRIDASTWKAIEESAPYLGRLSAERVKQELEKTMEQVPRPSEAIRLWLASGSMASLVPELASVTEAQLEACDRLAAPGPTRKPARRIARLAVLFLHVEPRRALEIATRLRFSKADAQAIFTVVDRWSRVGTVMRDGIQAGEPTDAAVRRWVAEIGRTNLPLVFRTVWAMSTSAPGGSDDPRWRRLYRRALETVYRDPLEVHDLAVDGDDLRRAGIPAGPNLGKILLALLDVVIEDPSRNTHDFLTGEALRRYGEMAGR